MAELFLDFETRSRLNLRQVGAYRYAEDPSTETVAAAYALDDRGLLVWAREAANAAESNAAWERTLNALADPHGPVVVAHNAEFERLILRHKWGLDLPASRFRCTAAQAARCGLPRQLEAASEALRLAIWDAQRKRRLINKLARPRRSGEFWSREEAGEDYDELEQDCVRDAEACRKLHRLLPPLGEQEQALWELTVAMNDRGLAVDLDSLARAVPLVEAEQARVAAEFERLVGAAPASPRARELLGLVSLDKEHVRRYLRDPRLDPRVRQALLLRQRWAKSSLAKLGALRARTSADGRLRGSLIYCGAERTGRWSSGGVQWHNAPRGLGEGTDLAFEALRTGVLRAVYDDPLLTISDMLKGFLVGPFLVGDYGQIEARDLAWQAGQADLLADFAAGRDAYCDMASEIYGQTVRDYGKTGDPADYDESIHMAKRQLGKVAVLGCGYGLGRDGLVRNAEKQFNLLLDAGLAERVVSTYRRRYPRVPALWRTLGQGLAYAVANRASCVRVGPVLIGTREFEGRRFAFVGLPSGRRMWYYEPRVDDEDGVTYLGRDRYRGGKWGRVRTYGGMVTENVVQATSRDVLAEALLRLDRAGFHLALQVHDEAVAEDPPDGLPEFRRLMELRPKWAQELPLVADAYATGRYRK